jgi:alpha-mannosidase
MLREIEFFATLASFHAKGYKYPKKEIDEMWENVLLYYPFLHMELI